MTEPVCVAACAPEPTGELGANGPDVAECFREALSSLASRPERDRDSGRYVAGGIGHGDTLERSAIFWTSVEPVKQDLLARVRASLAHDDNTAETLAGLTDAYAEVRVFRQAMFLRLAQSGGPLTTKGKRRSLYGAYLNALDREMKLANLLGLTRGSKPVPSVEAWLAGHSEPQDEAPGADAAETAPAFDCPVTGMQERAIASPPAILADRPAEGGGA